ncbi:MAG: tRNA 5-methoxyuridine(34)/uridine 5-oxyacetic acid(34) synthase CmoB [Halobacteriovoraceae bacterium]|nr:tRNA 5-methoxyuridine(34)/uridine 5-oxyacetic acid(34) synthase CmoB [Halobacteriovoraceae bacterium]
MDINQIIESNDILKKDIEKAYKQLDNKIYAEKIETIKKLKALSNFKLVSNNTAVELESINKKDNSPDIELYLRKFIPWKKGPFKIDETFIDSEWKSHLKWNRISKMIPDLKNKSILDIGCNNGFFMFKMLESNPKNVLGIDPSLPCYLQFKAIKSLIKEKLPINFKPLGVQHLPQLTNLFDVIFHMGIIYHHKNPIQQLQDLKKSLRPKGHLIIETINIPGAESTCLFPEDRYAKMKNIWFIPTTNCLVNWLKKVKFKKIEVLFDLPLTNEEQRVTEWSGNQSLDDFLDPQDKSKTIEGHPAPRRVAILASI